MGEAVRVRVRLIRHFKTCTTDIYLQNECAHVGLSVHAPVDPCREEPRSVRSRPSRQIDLGPSVGRLLPHVVYGLFPDNP